MTDENLCVLTAIFRLGWADDDEAANERLPLLGTQILGIYASEIEANAQIGLLPRRAWCDLFASDPLWRTGPGPKFECDNVNDDDEDDGPARYRRVIIQFHITRAALMPPVGAMVVTLVPTFSRKSWDRDASTPWRGPNIAFPVFDVERVSDQDPE